MVLKIDLWLILMPPHTHARTHMHTNTYMLSYMARTHKEERINLLSTFFFWEI